MLKHNGEEIQSPPASAARIATRAIMADLRAGMDGVGGGPVAVRGRRIARGSCRRWTGCWWGWGGARVSGSSAPRSRALREWPEGSPYRPGGDGRPPYPPFPFRPHPQPPPARAVRGAGGAQWAWRSSGVGAWPRPGSPILAFHLFRAMRNMGDHAARHADPAGGGEHRPMAGKIAADAAAWKRRGPSLEHSPIPTRLTGLAKTPRGAVWNWNNGCGPGKPVALAIADIDRFKRHQTTGSAMKAAMPV